MSSLYSSLILTSMALALDTSRQLRSLNELSQLIEAISKANISESEPNWLEWKREADLSHKRWHAVIGKFIIGFANRDPAVAKREAGGCAYLVLGVEPGNVLGVSPIDNAVLQARVSRYVRETVRWSPQYIEFGGKHVLVITVEPPQNGDLITAMLKSYPDVCREGNVFIRRHGRTDLATQEDYDILLQRFATGAEQATGISVQPIGVATAISVACGPHEVAAWCQHERNVLLAPFRRRPLDGALFLSARLSTSFEGRSAEEYRSEVESYLAEVTPLLPDKARIDALLDRSPNFQLLLTNETERNFTAVRVEITIEGDIWAYQDEAKAQPDGPSAPRIWGTSPFFHYIPPMQAMPSTDMLGPYIENSGSTRIEFEDVDLRPMARVKLDSIHLVTDAPMAGATLTAKWTATSASANGIATGELPIKVSSEIVSPLQQ